MLRSNLSELCAEGNIAVLTIDNGPKNLLTEPEFIDRGELLGWLDENPQIGALVITGKGRHFSHGADVSLFGSAGENGLSEKLENARELLRTIERLPIVTAAAINGGCFGGGLEIAMSCTFRIASPKSRLGLTEVMHGVVPGMGGIEKLTRIVGKEKAVQMILGCEMLSAESALDTGLITKISEDKDSLEETKAFVRELIDGKNTVQINALLNTINNALAGAEDPSKGMFEKALAEAEKK
ncbi:MAG: enoyl-CoA hydratase/isomerase family protein [Ruminococcus sp.]|jgi:enoyl-CoA hydratase|nr:enoyl-CoA hydratase/isomerase family protein [Ruminococcus sp.]